MTEDGTCRIVVTGGPGGGKTTAADFFRREIGDSVVVVPEAATMLFGGGFPRSEERMARKAAQRAIFAVQRQLEEVQTARYPGRVLICDRGTIDGAAYWPGGTEGFFDAMNTTIENELGRYDAVVFFETAAVGGLDIENSNPCRIEDQAQAVALDGVLRGLWSQHPRFVLVPHDVSFFEKIGAGLRAIQNVVAEIGG
jgi:predicted ATPase